MSSWLRFIVTFIRSSLKPKIPVGEIFVIDFRVWPQECDLKFINNAKVLTLLEMARLDVMVRSGIIRKVIKEGLYIPVGSIAVTYHRPIKRFQKVSLHTKITGYDDRWFYLRHDIFSGKKVYVSAVVRAMMKKGKEAIPPQTLIDELGGSPFPYLSDQDKDLTRRLDAPSL